MAEPTPEQMRAQVEAANTALTEWAKEHPSRMIRGNEPRIVGVVLAAAWGVSAKSESGEGH